MAIDFVCGDTFGTSVERLAGTHLRVTESVYRSRETIPEHDHLLPALCVVLEGGYADRFPCDHVDCPAGTAIYYAPGHVHSTTFGEHGGRCLDVTIEPSIFEGNSPMTARLASVRGSRLVLPRADTFTLARATCVGDDLFARTLEELALGLFADLLRLPGMRLGSDPPAWLRRVRDRLDAELTAPPGLVDLAADAGVHRVHVARAFRRHYGCTTGEYVRIRRVSMAVAALRSRDRSLSHVAHGLGFADQSHLTRTFRELVGITPGEFRRLYGAPA